MEILLERIKKTEKYTMGKLYVDGKYICDTCEDIDRGLTDSMSVNEIKSKKVRSETAIPSGRYKVTLDVISPKFKNDEFYVKNADNSRIPRLLNVKGFDGILIHCGSSQNSSAGCIIVGESIVE